MLKLTKYLRPFKPGIVCVLLLLLMQAMLELFLPTLMSSIVNEGIMYSAIHDVDRVDFIVATGLQMLLVALMAGGCAIFVGYISPKIAAGAARDLRRDLFDKVEHFSQAEFDKFSSASLITRCTNDVAQVQALANVFARMLLYAPILGMGGIIMALTRSVSMAWIIALAVIVLLCLAFSIIRVVMPRFKIVQELMDALNRVSREVLHGLMVIRAFGAQKRERERFDATNTDLRTQGLFIGRVMAVVMPAITLIMGGTQILVIWVGAHHVDMSGLEVGDMMAFMQYAMQVILAFMLISMVLVMVPRAQVSAARIREVLDTLPVINDSPTPQEFPEDSPGKVVFRGVSFRYPGAEADVLSDISFEAHPGKTTAIIGSTGSGKSTIAHLLLRFYDITDGSICVDDIDVRDVRQAALRDKIGLVPQRAQLLSGTIASNITYGKPDASADEIDRAAQIAQAMEFISEKEEGAAFEISQGGSNVSGGQRQRLSIARALAKNPQILVFDDSFSALDFKTDRQLRRALAEHIRSANVIVIAQRVGTIMNADEIIVLEQGKIVGRGTHTALLADCPEYYEIAASQGMLEQDAISSEVPNV